MEIKDYGVDCPYCGVTAELVGGEHVYPHRKDLYDKYFYVCEPCDARVGCHPGSTQPMGRLADATLRKAKTMAHAHFDPLWRKGPMTRKEAYHWLRTEMGLSHKECHIGKFDVEQCHRVVALSRKY